MSITQTVEFAKKYDRSFVLVFTAVSVIVTAYLAFGTKLNSLVAGTPIVSELQTKFRVQEEINGVFKEDLREMKTDIKTILRNMPRR